MVPAGVGYNTHLNPPKPSYGDAVNVLMLLCVHHWFHHLVIFHFYLRFRQISLLPYLPYSARHVYFCSLVGIFCSIVVG
jgi:hypothetical protein